MFLQFVNFILIFTVFPLLPTGDSVAETFVSVPLTSQNPPPAAQLQAPSQMVAGGREAAPQPPCTGPGLSESAGECYGCMDGLKTELTGHGHRGTSDEGTRTPVSVPHKCLLYLLLENQLIDQITTNNKDTKKL